LELVIDNGAECLFTEYSAITFINDRRNA
jgi:hypothetical protein